MPAHDNFLIHFGAASNLYEGPLPMNTRLSSQSQRIFPLSAAIRKDLYDAHFRLGLLEYQDGNFSHKKRYFEKFKKLEPRYKHDGSNKEIRVQIQYLNNVLG